MTLTLTLTFFSQGSVMVTYDVTFRADSMVTPSNVNKVFLGGLNRNNTLPSGALSIDLNSVTHQGMYNT